MAYEASKMPSSKRCGLRAMSSRSLKVPGSDSSAFTARYLGLGLSLGTKLHFIPVGKPAPPRPRRLLFFTSSMTWAGCMPSTFSSVRYPPLLRYASSVQEFGCPQLRVMTFSGASGIDDSWPASGAGLELGEDCVHCRPRPEVLVVDLVDLQAGRGAAGGETLGLAQGPGGVGVPGPHPELLLEVREEVLRSPQAAREVGADVHDVLAGTPGVEHDVEGGDLVGPFRGDLESASHQLQPIGWEPSLHRLQEVQCGKHRRALPVRRVVRENFCQSVVEDPLLFGRQKGRGHGARAS